MKTPLLIILLSCLINVSYGQYAKISGRVTDSRNNPIGRATISFKGSMLYQTIADDNGNYTTVRNINSDSVIVCRHVNFKTLEQKIQNNNIVNLRLQDNEDVNILPVINDSLFTNPDSLDIVNEVRFVDSFQKANSEKIFTRAEISPHFQGGNVALKAYYQINLKAANTKLSRSVNGIVTIGFRIEKDGSITDIKLLKGIQKEIDNKILSLTASLPKWKAAMQNGKYCEYNYILSIPVNLRISNRQRI